MSNPIRVVIADDHPLFREGVAHSLASEPDMNVVGQAATGEEALRLMRDLLPDVLLLDIAMPGQGGIAAAGEIAVACPATHIVMLTVSEHEDDLMSAFKAGVRGYVLKGISAGELAAVVRTISAGEVFVSPALAAEMFRELSRPKQSDPLSDLTERESQVLQLVAEGLTNREIGKRLFLAEKTVKHYMTKVLQKLQVRSRVGAGLLAQRRGLDEASDRDKY
ncbi:MAG: response regulator transcription factor [Anaerolineae bacterium]|nr:response regulator transcription factor [Anaerolineae bacterium]